MAGFRTFATGEVLTAANVNNFLMKQSVMVFADAAARTTALGAEVVEGMLTYNEETAQLEVFDGATFVLAVQPPAGIGSNVVQTVKTDTFTTTSATFTTVTGLTATITPSSATSRILIIAQITVGFPNFSTTGFFKVTRGGTDIYRGAADGDRIQTVFGGFSDVNLQTSMISQSIVFLDSPTTASATTYQVETRRTVSGTVFVNRPAFDSGADANVGRGASSITVIEVAP